MTRAQFDSCRENRGMIAALNGIKERGRTLGIIGTPNFFIHGKLVKSVDRHRRRSARWWIRS